MPKIQESKLPEKALSSKYVCYGAFTDCFFIDIPHKVSFEEYIEAFYTTPLFKLERVLLSIFARKPSTDENAKQLALGSVTEFSAWTVENRLPDQILLCDFTKKTRSWLMLDYQTDAQTPFTRLFFGSVVISKSVSGKEQTTFGFLFHALNRVHNLYSRALLKAAFRKLKKAVKNEKAN